MKVSEHWKWMDKKVAPDKRRVTDEFMAGVNEFVEFVCAQDQFKAIGKLRCPCKKCKCKAYHFVNEVKAHLCMKGFMSDYYYWINHDEPRPPIPLVVADNSYYGSNENDEGSSSQESANRIYLDVVGGPNKTRRIYGLGLQATNVVGSFSTPSFSSIDGVSPTEIIAMQAQIQALTDELRQKKLEQDMMKQKMERWEERFRSLLLGSQFGTLSHVASQLKPSHPAPREEDDHDDEEMGDNVTNYDDPNL